MREDMFKVIVERPRWGSRFAPKAKLRLDKYPGRRRATGQRMMMEQTGFAKSLNENLAPLKRYLHKQIGRQWNDVFSDICQHLDTGSTVKMHVREHIDDFVVRHISRDRAGNLIGQQKWGRPNGPSEWRQALYVDPVDGILKETRALCQTLGIPTARQRWKKQKVPDLGNQIRRRSDTGYLVRLGGVWYQIALNMSPTCSNEALLLDLHSDAWKRHKRWEIVYKGQLGKKALRDLRLKNRIPTDRSQSNG